jgi:hypothetical protein
MKVLHKVRQDYTAVAFDDADIGVVLESCWGVLRQFLAQFDGDDIAELCLEVFDSITQEGSRLDECVRIELALITLNDCPFFMVRRDIHFLFEEIAEIWVDRFDVGHYKDFLQMLGLFPNNIGRQDRAPAVNPIGRIAPVADDLETETNIVVRSQQHFDTMQASQ